MTIPEQPSLLARLSRLGKGRVVRVFGLLLSTVLVVAIGHALWLERGQFAGIELDRAFLLTSILGVGVAMSGNLLGSAGAWLLLRRQATAFTLPYTIVLNGLAQMAKYLPGNVLHLLGRFYLIKEHSDTRTALLYSIAEVVLLGLGAIAIGLFYLHYLQPGVWPLPALAFLALLIPGTGIALMFRLRWLKATLQDLALVLLLYALSYLSYGVAFNLLLLHVFDSTGADILLCAALFALAFITGYVTPGASGGLGVREFAFTLLAQPFLDPAVALATIVLFRALSVAGDLLFGLLALATRRYCHVQLVSRR